MWAQCCQMFRFYKRRKSKVFMWIILNFKCKIIIYFNHLVQSISIGLVWLLCFLLVYARSQQIWLKGPNPAFHLILHGLIDKNVFYTLLMVENIKRRLILYDVKTIWNLNCSVGYSHTYSFTYCFWLLLCYKSRGEYLQERPYSHHVHCTTNCNDAVITWQHFKMHIIIYCLIYLLLSVHTHYIKMRKQMWIMCSRQNISKVSMS